VHKNGRIHSFLMLVWTVYTPSCEKRYVIQLTQADSGGSGPAEAIQSLSPYILQDQIDEALCGSVFTAVNKNTGENVVVKVQDKARMDANQKERAEAEYEIAAKLNHPNIIGYLEQIDTGQHICTVMEYGRDGNLSNYVSQRGKLSEPEARHFFVQLASAVQHCHEKSCAHGDIKLENIVLDNGDIKLIDFSMSKQLVSTEGKRRTFCGTSPYIAPEVVLQSNYSGTTADIWSVGVCLFKMVTGDYPFDKIDSTLRGGYTMPPELSSTCQDLIRNILLVNPENRISIDKILTHPWVGSTAAKNTHVEPKPLI